MIPLPDVEPGSGHFDAASRLHKFKMTHPTGNGFSLLHSPRYANTVPLQNHVILFRQKSKYLSTYNIVCAFPGGISIEAKNEPKGGASSGKYRLRFLRVGEAVDAHSAVDLRYRRTY
jgi:hypothetical protein